MSFASFARRYLLEQAAQQGNTSALPPVPAYQGPIRQDLNLFEQSGQTMGAPAPIRGPAVLINAYFS
ncbi:MAG: hypothetical protein M3Q71_19510 [Chloroflexota bacterium]|nr:hypothetical protein [Chloroflexota bacterium]